MRDRSEKATAVRILRDNLQVEGDANLFSDQCDSVLSREAGGLDLGGTVDAEGLRRIVDLRKEFSPKATPRPFSENVPPSYETGADIRQASQAQAAGR